MFCGSIGLNICPVLITIESAAPATVSWACKFGVPRKQTNKATIMLVKRFIRCKDRLKFGNERARRTNIMIIYKIGGEMLTKFTNGHKSRHFLYIVRPSAARRTQLPPMAESFSSRGRFFSLGRKNFFSREGVSARSHPVFGRCFRGRHPFGEQSYEKNFTSYTRFTFMLMRTSHHNPFRGYSNPGNTMKNIKKRSKNKSFVNKWT